MMMETVISRSVRMIFAGGMAASLGLAAQAAFAQEAAIQRVEITGSSIKRITQEGALPVLSITQEDIKKSGATSVAELIQALPSMQGFTSSAESVNGGGGGTQTASIHTIGESYTLVLLNGRRMAPFGSGSAVNLGSIPLAAVERVEVLTDGASALYGSDAIAGVVNFILKKNQTDFQIEANYSSPQHPGGKGGNVQVSKGFGDLDKDNFNVLLAYSHDEQKELNAAQRDFGRSGVLPFSEGGKNYYYYNLAINTAPASTTLTFKTPVNGQAVTTFSPNFYKDNKCGANTFAVADALNHTSCWFDFGGTVELIPENKRDSFFTSGRLKLGENHTLFAEAMKTKFDLTGRFAPAAQALSLPLTDPKYATYITPYLAALGVDPANVKKASMNLRITDAGGRTNHYQAESTHLVLGAEGNLWNWDYNASFTASENIGSTFYAGGYLSRLKYNAIVAGGGFDPFAPSGSSTAALAPAVLHEKASEIKSNLDVLAMNASHEIFTLPGGGSMLGMGASFTKQKYSDWESAISQGNNVQQPDFHDAPLGSAAGSLPAGSSRKSMGAFAELYMPITKSFDVTTAVRHDRFKAVDSDVNFDIDGNLVGSKQLGNANNGTTYKIATSWRPTSSVLLRASYGTGFKAPSMLNVIAPVQDFGVSSGKYPCPVPSSAECKGTTQYAETFGGNPATGAAGLRPEKSKQGTVGLRVEPMAALSLGFDFWDVKMTDQIVTIDEDELFNNAAAHQGLFSVVFDQSAGENKLVAAIAPYNAATSVTGTTGRKAC